MKTRSSNPRSRRRQSAQTSAICHRPSAILRNLTPRELEMEQLRRAIAKSEQSLDHLHAAVEACQRKLLRRCKELNRQTRLQAIALKEAA